MGKTAYFVCRIFTRLAAATRQVEVVLCELTVLIWKLKSYLVSGTKVSLFGIHNNIPLLSVRSLFSSSWKMQGKLFWVFPGTKKFTQIGWVFFCVCVCVFVLFIALCRWFLQLCSRMISLILACFNVVCVCVCLNFSISSNSFVNNLQIDDCDSNLFFRLKNPFRVSPRANFTNRLGCFEKIHSFDSNFVFLSFKFPNWKS